MAHHFPTEYDHDIYFNSHPDLQSAGFDVEGLYQHYLRHGKDEGRKANLITTRDDFSSLIHEGPDVLEVLPGFAPIVSGPNVKYFETNTKEELTNRAVTLNVTPDNIPDVHFYQPDSDLGAVVRKFDVVVSAHVLNRQPDPIKHLQQIENILAADGYLMMVLPDKRYTYDHAYPTSTLTTLLAKHYNQQTIPVNEDLIGSSLMRTHSEADQHWKGDHGTPFPDLAERFSAITGTNDWNINGLQNREITTCTFTPDSFRELMRHLKEIGLTKMEVVRIYPTTYNKQEFYVILHRP